MVTPVLIDGFEHQVISLNSFSGGAAGIWDVAVDGTPTFPSGRNGVCLQCTTAATTVRGFKTVTSAPIFVTSVYIKTSTTFGSDTIVFIVETAGFSAAPSLTITTTGTIRAASGASNATGPTVNDGVWHRIDIRSNLSANPWLVDWQVDGAAQTQLSNATTASSIGLIQLGGTGTFTVQYDDLVCSATSADYPLGAHDVLYGVPTSDGTHVNAGGGIEDNAGTDLGTAWSLMDEWTPNTSDYVRQSVVGATDYGEVNFDDAPAVGKTIWGVDGYAALFSSNTNANTGTTRIVDSGGTTLTNIYSGTMNTTGLSYRRAIITAPGAGWDAGYAGTKARVGFSTDVDGIPEWTALMLQYAVTDGGGGGASVVDPFMMAGFFGG